MRGPPAILQTSCTFVLFLQEVSLKGNCDSLVSDGRFEQNTTQCAFDTCHTRIFFSCVRGARCVVLCLVFLENYSISSVFRGTLFDALLTSPFSAPLSTLEPHLKLLRTRGHGTKCRRVFLCTMPETGGLPREKFGIRWVSTGFAYR